MELFYTKNVNGDRCFLDEEESRHCIKVLRHRKGDNVDVIDGHGSLFHGVIEDDGPKGICVRIADRVADWGGHPYCLDLAVCPTKNMERYEWFVEKVCELGVDSIIPVIGDHSERRVLKTERLSKLAISASKQSLKAYVPEISEPLTVKEFIADADPNSLRLFAFCFDVNGHQKISIRKALTLTGNGKNGNEPQDLGCGVEENAKPHVIIMIGPEGDFSPEEAQLAMAHGFTPIHLGASRLRTETAALLSAISVYTEFI